MIIISLVMSAPLSLGLLLRRARALKRLTQSELATRAGVSQALVSYYERDLKQPGGDVLGRLEQVLDVPSGELSEAVERGRGGARQVNAAVATIPSRRGFLATLEHLPGDVVWLDRPVASDGGDLAFALDLRSHVLMVLVDAPGSGPVAVIDSRLAAASAFGAATVPGGGVPEPEDVVETVLRYWATFAPGAPVPAVGAISFERRSRFLRLCWKDLPPPYVRSRRVARWTGKPVGPAGAHVGELKADGDLLLLAATDGVAHARTQNGRALWDAPELRTLVARARRAASLVDSLQKRLDAAGNVATDDALAIVVSWPS